MTPTPLRRPRRAPARRRPGFTLIELMLGLTIGTVLISSTLAITLMHARAVSKLGGKIHQVEELRTSYDLLSVELMEVLRGGITGATPDSMTVRVPVGWGVVCGALNRMDVWSKHTKKKNRAVDSTVLAVHLDLLPKAIGSPEADGFAISEDYKNWQYYPVPDWPTMQLRSTRTARQQCLGVAEDAATTSYQETSLLRSLVLTRTGTPPDERALFVPYLQVSYFFRPDPTRNGDRTLWRSTYMGADKLEGAFEPNAGFAYKLDDGTVLTTVADSATMARIRWVQVNLRSSRQDEKLWKNDSLVATPWVALYNSR